MGAPPGNDNAAGNPGGPGAPEGNEYAKGNPGGRPPENNTNAMRHGVDVPDEQIIARGNHDAFINEFVESVDLPEDEAIEAACSMIRADRAAAYLASECTETEEWAHLLKRLRRESSTYMDALGEL